VTRASSSVRIDIHGKSLAATCEGTHRGGDGAAGLAVDGAPGGLADVPPQLGPRLRGLLRDLGRPGLHAQRAPAQGAGMRQGS